MKRKITKRTMILVLLAALVLSTGVAYAYFTDYEQARGGAAIYLNGQTTIEEDADEAKKVITISNTGDTDVIVRVAVYGDYISNVDFSTADWTKDGDFYYYNKILPAGQETTSSITANIDTEKAKAAGHDFEIIVVHESSRVLYDGTEANRVVKPSGWTYPDISVGM